jgi:5-deoxy-D-glucuronate isomerase
VKGTEYTVTLGDGTRVVCWLDGGFWRAKVDHEGTDFVRIDTREEILERIPARYVHLRAGVVSDLIVLKHCQKSAELLGCWEQFCAEDKARR